MAPERAPERAPDLQPARPAPVFATTPQVAAPPTDAAVPEAEQETKPNAILTQLQRFAKVIAVVLVGVAGYSAYTMWSHHQPYQWSGAVEIRTVAVGSRSGGRVKDLLVHEGQLVKQGAPLLVLEGTELMARKEMAEAEVEAADAALEKLIHGARPEELAQAAARVAEARASVAHASSLHSVNAREAARAARLAKSGAISSAEHETKLGAARAAAGAAGQASANVKEAEAALRLLTGGARPEDIRAARAQVGVARAKLNAVKAQVDELTIRAPRDGRVERVLVRPGDILRADAPSLTLLEAGQLYVKIFIPETRIGNVHVGQEVPISVDSFPNRRFKGRVDHISEVGEYTPRRLVTTEERADEVFAAKITVLEGESDLRSGMAAFVHVPK